MKKEHFDFLINNRACKPGLKWAKTQSNLYELWNNCHRGDWLLWLAEELQVDKGRLMLCAALCAHTVIHLMEDRRSREAVRIAFLYARGKATDVQLQEARRAANAAADADAAAAYWAAAADAAAYWAADADAAATAYWAADADAAATAYWAADADAAATAYWAADADAAATANQLRTAEIARKILTEEVFEKIKEIE